MPYAAIKQTECYPQNKKRVSSTAFWTNRTSCRKARTAREVYDARVFLNSRRLAEECLTPSRRQSSGSTRLVLHVTNSHRGTMALEPTSR
jgi:hypothetical protein